MNYVLIMVVVAIAIGAIYLVGRECGEKLKSEKEKYDTLKKKYDELCRMDCQKLYGDEVIKRKRAEREAAEHKAKAEAYEEMVIVANAWVTTLTNVCGEVSVPASNVRENLESGVMPVITFDREADTYSLKIKENEQCVQE